MNLLFLWDYLKNRVYASNPQTIDELKNNIETEISAISENVLKRVSDNMCKRVQLCIHESGGHWSIKLKNQTIYAKIKQ